MLTRSRGVQPVAPLPHVLHYRMERKMYAIPEEVRTEFAAIMDAIPPIPPEAWNAFGAVAAGGLLILVVYILNLFGK